jgi:shikimate kinase
MHRQSCIFLIGAMGAGKSAVGRTLARLLGYEFADTDHFIERQSGVDISFIFEKEGESGFRAREQRALETLSLHKNIVIATGGGCIKTPANRDLMRDSGTVIYLQASVDQLYERVRCSSHRPLINTDNPKAVLAGIVHERVPVYEQIADLTIDTERRRVRAVAQDILRQLNARSGQSEQHDSS